jgi:hypothetical protein
MNCRASVFSVLALLISGGAAFAQATPSLEALSQYERTTASRLIDRLHSGNEQEFVGEFDRFVEDFAGRSLNTRPVASVLKASAGDQRDLLNRVLDSQCRKPSPRKTIYCDLAQLEDPRAADIQTAATGAAGGALGGAISVSSGSGGARGAGNAGGGDSGRANVPRSFSFRGGSGGGVSENTTVYNIVSVPGPEAGAGLGGLVVGAVLLWRRRAAARQR